MILPSIQRLLRYFGDVRDGTIATAAQPVLEFDKKTRAAVLPYKSNVPVRTLGWLSDAGDQPQLRLLAGAVLVTSVVAADRRMIRAGLRMILAHELATAAKSFIKHRVDRTRPRSASRNADEEPRPGHSGQKEDTSFPSGHSAGAMAVARAMGREYPKHRTAAAALAAGIGLVQIPRCAHYPSDVVVGLGLGIAAEALVQLAWQALDRDF